MTDRDTDKVGTFSPHISLPSDQYETVAEVFREAGYSVERKERNALQRAVTGRDHNEMWDTYLLIRE